MERAALATGHPHRACAAAVPLLLALLVAWAAAPAVDGEPTPSRQPVELVTPWSWRPMPSPGGVGSEGLTAVAAQLAPSGGAWVAVGDAQGVALRPPGESFRFAARVPLVTDLRFGPDGALWIASLNGLWRLSRDGRLEDHSPAPGEAARRVRRLAMGAGVIVLATDAGAYLSDDGRSWEQLRDGLPSGSVVSVALRVSPESGDGSALEVWAVVGARLWRVVVAASELGLRPLGARVEVIVGRPAGGEPVDVVTNLPGAEVVLLYPRALALLRVAPVDATCELPGVPGAGCELRAGAVEEGLRPGRRHWQIVRPTLPPGAAARRVSAAGGCLWLATDRGLLEAHALTRSWRRSGAPAGSTPSWSVVEVGRELLAASQLGLLAGSPAVPVAAASGAADLARAAARLAAEPGILEVQRAALRYLDLQPARVRALRRGLARRGWLPSVGLRAGVARDREFSRDDDDAVVYGDRYALRDEARERSRQFDASIVFTWDFADLAFNPDSVDVSREVRQVIALRDDVLDEIGQLYFERKSVLMRLPASPTVGPASKSGAPASASSSGGAISSDLEQLRLQLRAEELAAGLDAWTGGWFSAHIREASRRLQVPSDNLSPR